MLAVSLMGVILLLSGVAAVEERTAESREAHLGIHPFRGRNLQVNLDINIDWAKLVERVKAFNTTWKIKSTLEEIFQRGGHQSLSRRLGELELEEDILPVLVQHTRDRPVPREFDARRQWQHCPTLRQIQDQGVCGSCWAVATASAFSDRACIAGLSRTELSSNALLSCCGEGCGQGCRGGSSQLAWQYLQQAGIPSGGAYNSSKGCQPYEVESCDHSAERGGGMRGLPACSSLPDSQTPPCRRQCTNPAYFLPYETDIVKVDKAYILKNNVTEIQLEILYNGPVTAVMEVFTDFYTYHSGVYHQVAGEKVGLHVVRLLGWGSTPGGTDFWLAANSWNELWGEGGTFRIRRGTNECRIEGKVTAGLVRLDPARALVFQFFGKGNKMTGERKNEGLFSFLRPKNN